MYFSAAIFTQVNDNALQTAVGTVVATIHLIFLGLIFEIWSNKI